MLTSVRKPAAPYARLGRLWEAVACASRVRESQKPRASQQPLASLSAPRLALALPLAGADRPAQQSFGSRLDDAVMLRVVAELAARAEGQASHYAARACAASKPFARS